jgi:hypothetical protein
MEYTPVISPQPHHQMIFPVLTSCVGMLFNRCNGRLLCTIAIVDSISAPIAFSTDFYVTHAPIISGPKPTLLRFFFATIMSGPISSIKHFLQGIRRVGIG